MRAMRTQCCKPGCCQTIGAVVAFVIAVTCFGMTANFANLAATDPRSDKVSTYNADQDAWNNGESATYAAKWTGPAARPLPNLTVTGDKGGTGAAFQVVTVEGASASASALWASVGDYVQPATGTLLRAVVPGYHQLGVNVDSELQINIGADPARRTYSARGYKCQVMSFKKNKRMTWFARREFLTSVEILHHDASSDDVSLATTTPLDEVNCPYQWTQATDVVYEESTTTSSSERRAAERDCIDGRQPDVPLSLEIVLRSPADPRVTAARLSGGCSRYFGKTSADFVELAVGFGCTGAAFLVACVAFAYCAQSARRQHTMAVASAVMMVPGASQWQSGQVQSHPMMPGGTYAPTMPGQQQPQYSVGTPAAGSGYGYPQQPQEYQMQGGQPGYGSGPLGTGPPPQYSQQPPQYNQQYSQQPPQYNQQYSQQPTPYSQNPSHYSQPQQHGRPPMI